MPMFDFNINNPNEYVPEDAAPALPKSTIGKGGLSAMAAAARGTPQNPNAPQGARLLGGLQGEHTQAELEDMLFPRIRDMGQINQARDQRRQKLNVLQEALAMEEDTTDPLTYMLHGMMTNPDPSSIGTGFRKGVAEALEAGIRKPKQKRDAAVQSGKVGLDFEVSEGNNDDQLEQTAISNLRTLAKPILDRGTGGGAGGAGGSGYSGVRFKNSPQGMIDTWNVDANGIPKVVIPDVKMGMQLRTKALAMAEAQAAKDNMAGAFKSDAERQAWIQKRADENTEIMLGGMDLSAPTNPAVLPASAPSNRGAGKVKVDPAAVKINPAVTDELLDGLTATESAGKATAVNKKTKALGPYQFMPETAAMLHEWGIKFNPFDPQESREAARWYLSYLAEQNGGDMRKALADYGGHKTVDPAPYIGKVEKNGKVKVPGKVGEMAAAVGDVPLRTPEEQAQKNAMAQGTVKGQLEYYDKLRNDQEAALKTVGAVKELRQLKFDPGAFAQWKKRGGNIMEALGSDGPLARAAAQSGNAEAILQGLSNARISLEKGVQTKDDELRFKKEIAQITDPKAGYEYMLKYMNELAAKQVEQFNTVDKYKRSKGSLDGVEQVWQKRSEQYGGLLKKYQGQFVGRSEFINAIMSDPKNKAAYKGDEEKLRERAEREWRALGGGK